MATILPEPAKVRLLGRGPDYDAPAGFFRKQFPVTAGPVAVELYRGGKRVLKLTSPEPVTDRPFREDNGLVCFSTEEDRHWQADFKDAKPFQWSEYGDVNNNGLPNWFEMYWYGKFGDISTANACPNPDAKAVNGQTLLECYRNRLDPTAKAFHYADMPRQRLLAWYRAETGVMADSDGRISQWQDQSGNKLNLLSTTEAEKPRLVKNVWNKLPAVEFDGVHNAMLCPIPENGLKSITVIAVYSAQATEQICQIQQGQGNRLISIPTRKNEDYQGGIAMTVSALDFPTGDVATLRRVFAAGDAPTHIGLGFMVNNRQLQYRNWIFKGKVAEILIFSPALDEAGMNRVRSALLEHYKL